MRSLHLRLPRFQFFYDSFELFKAAIKLSFADTTSQDNENEFLHQMKGIFQRKHALITSSYRIALYHTLRAIGARPSGEVLLAPITIADTVNAIKLTNFKPCWVDIDPETHCICLEDLKRKLNPNSQVLLVTYLSGIVPNLRSILEFAKTNNLIVIEDISQIMGGEYENHPIGSQGDISLASLSCGKNISSLYGGLLLSNDQDLMNKIKVDILGNQVHPKKSVIAYYLKNCLKVQIATSGLLFPMIVFPILQILSYIKHQRPVDFEHDPPLDLNIFRSTGIGLRKEFPKSFFAHLCDWQYSLMRHQVITLTKKTNRRRELAKALVGHLTLNSLTLVPKGLLKFDDNSYYHFPIHCMGKKKEMRDFLFMNGIDNGSYGLNLCTEEHALCGQEMAMPMAKMVKHDSIFLPIHESYSFEHMKHIAQTVNQYVITDQS